MKIIIECSENGFTTLFEAIQNKLNDCVRRYNNSEWQELKRMYASQELSLHDILAQIVEQVYGGKENDS